VSNKLFGGGNKEEVKKTDNQPTGISSEDVQG
jgi:hypothetical protein